VEPGVKRRVKFSKALYDVSHLLRDDNCPFVDGKTDKKDKKSENR
jgi:hypothetical protein